jgi:predicted DNA-binding antitoxin AbrB/MazE fold protein
MQKTFEAVYENGVFRLVEQLPLPDHSQVTVTISDRTLFEGDASAYFSAEEWDRAKSDNVTLEEVRRALSSIDGSLSDAVIASRSGERLSGYLGADQWPVASRSLLHPLLHSRGSLV